MSTVDSDSYTIGGVDLYFNASPGYASLLATDPAVASGLGGAMRSNTNNLGNITSVEINPEVSYIEHFISDCGLQKRDKKATNMTSMTINFTFDEINSANLKKYFAASTLGTGKLAVFEQALTEGAAQIVFKTNVGQDLTYFIPKCTISADGPLGINRDDWWTGPMTLDVLFYDTGSWASKPYGMVLASTINC